MRYARWVAVSTPSQAEEDKVSLKVQAEKTKAVAEGKGWKETAGPFSVPGISRTRWVNLRDAEAGIPALREMLDSAKRGEFDVLVVYDFNRFRDLLDQVARVLIDYRVQIYSVAQPVEPQAAFDPYSAQTSAMMQKFSGLISQSEIDTLRMQYRDKMPMRVTVKGLHAGTGKPPYGYRRPSKERFVILVQVPSEVQVLLQMKAWFFAGNSSRTIARKLNEAGIPSPKGKRWGHNAVAYMLANPFYGGVVSFGATHYQRDRRNGTSKVTKSTPVTNKGKHVPIWDEAEHQRIVQEMRRRGQGYPGVSTRQLSRLLRCHCGATMHACQFPEGVYWRCGTMHRGHASIRNERALEQVIAGIVHTAQNLEDAELPQPEDRRPALREAIKDLQLRRSRWMDAFEAGELNPRELAGKIKELDERIAGAEAELESAGMEQDAVNNTKDLLTALSEGVESWVDYVRGGDAVEVNAGLREIVAYAVVGKDKTITLHWH